MDSEIDQIRPALDINIQVNRMKTLKIRHGFEALSADFVISAECWINRPVCKLEGAQSLAITELACIFRHDMQLPATSLPVSMGGTFHDLRSKVAVVMNALSLLCIVESRQDRKEMVAIIKRNLGHLTATVHQVCLYIEDEPGQEGMITLLADTSEKLGKALHIEFG